MIFETERKKKAAVAYTAAFLMTSKLEPSTNLFFLQMHCIIFENISQGTEIPNYKKFMNYLAIYCGL